MVDHKYFYDKSVELGFTTRDYESLVNLHENGAWTLKIMGCTSVFEFGSGLGFFLSACQRIGLYRHVGYDINPYERDFAISKGVAPEKYLIGDFAKIKLGKYDAIYSTEVFEHMTDEELDKVLPKLYKACNKYFYFTSTPHASTPEWDAEWGHINLKSKEQWIEMIEKYDFKYNHDDNSVTSWGMVFKKN